MVGICNLPKKIGSSDNFYTPEYAINPLLTYINPSWRIWECCAGTGNIVKFFKDRGMNIFGTDILSGVDFLGENDGYMETYDCIITNPPFSLKDKFLKRCYEINKPFAMLLPLTALEGKFRQSLYKKHGIQVILFNRRINYQGHQNKNSCWFASAWFCYKLNLPKDLNFVEI